MGAVLALPAAPALAALTPTVTKVEPSSGPASGGTSVTITGTNFTGATAVDFFSTPAASFTVNSNTSITAVTPSHVVGAFVVNVTTPAGTSNSGVRFLFVGSLPIFINGVKATTTRRPVIAVGEITLHNQKIGNVTCNSVSTALAFNETTEGTEEKGFLNTVGYGTFNCESTDPCKVKNTKGEEVEGIHLTAESPPEPVSSTEAHATGITSLPWTGETIEREEGIRQVLMKHVKL